MRFGTERFQNAHTPEAALKPRQKRPNPKLAVAYTRMSTAKQDLSLDGQKMVISAWAAQAGLEVVAWFEDPARSGSTPPKRRPGLLAALESLETLRAGVLVVAADKLSTIVDWKDRNTCVLFGDGAGAAVLRNRPNSHGLLTTCMGADGNKGQLLCMPGGGSQCPATTHSIASGMHFLRMDGKETFKNAVNAMHIAATEALRRCNLDISQIKCVIPHQANRRIIDAVSNRIGATPAQLFVNLEKYGNTSAASIAIALDEAVHQGRVEKGDLILLIAFGAGLTWAAAVIEW